MLNMIKSFNLATTIERYKYALETIESIYDQADIIRVYLNDFNQIPKEFNKKKIHAECGPDLNCSAKFNWCHEPDQYYFTVDDDIIYPKSYAADTINNLNKFNDKICITFHGRLYSDKKIKSYFNDKLKVYCFHKTVHESVYVNILGAGVSAFNTNLVKINKNLFKYNFMDDIEVSIQLMHNKIPIVVIAHNEDYFKWTNLYKSQNILTLYEKYKNNDELQTARFNEVQWGLSKLNSLYNIKVLKV
jgi:hypothetical protein